MPHFSVQICGHLRNLWLKSREKLNNARFIDVLRLVPGGFERFDSLSDALLE